jgi:ADP-heptose:LPS heptosyltransferase
MYPLDKWAKVMSAVADKTDCLFFFTGATQDFQMYEELGQLAAAQSINLAGKLSLRQSMALYEQMNVSLCVDSGPAHLSAAVGTPTVTLFGPTDPERWRPLGAANVTLYDESLSCRPCNYNKTCSNRECLTQFSAEKIVQACFHILNGAEHGSKLINEEKLCSQAAEPG